jgi:hypothetical protein
MFPCPDACDDTAEPASFALHQTFSARLVFVHAIEMYLSQHLDAEAICMSYTALPLTLVPLASDVTKGMGRGQCL